MGILKEIVYFLLDEVLEILEDEEWDYEKRIENAINHICKRREIFK